MSTELLILAIAGWALLAIILGINHFFPTGQEEGHSEIPEEFEEFVEQAQQLATLADAMGWPPEWIVCPACAEYAWRLPPHLFSPCPLLSQTANSMGLKLDAERMTAVRTGAALERQGEVLEKLFRTQFDDDDEDGDE